MSVRLATVRAVLWRSALFAMLLGADRRPSRQGGGGVNVVLATIVALALTHQLLEFITGRM